MSKNKNISFDKIKMILSDLAWWINELHGETTQNGKNWTIFHGAISPNNIRIIEQENRVYAVIGNYEIAQDILSNVANINVWTDETLVNIKVRF